MTRVDDLASRLTGLSFEVMESREVVVGDMISGDARFHGPAKRRPDGGIVWTEAPPEEDDDGGPYDSRSWSISTENVALDGFTLPWLDVSVEEPAVEPDQVRALAAFLLELDAHDATFRAAIAEQALEANRDLISDLFEFLPPEVREELFPGWSSGEAMTGEMFVAGLTLCRVGFHPGGVVDDAQREIVADYRFLTAAQPPQDEDDVAPTYNGLHDATGQTLAVYAARDGRVIDVSHES